VEQPRDLNPNPEFSTAEVSSLHLDEPFGWLALKAIDSLTIDGHRFISVEHYERQTDATLHIVCSTELGESHLFSFNPVEESEITHLFLPKDV
jgi:hypothetical protein